MFTYEEVNTLLGSSKKFTIQKTEINVVAFTVMTVFVYAHVPESTCFGLSH